jgi:hypothetical protein
MTGDVLNGRNGSVILPDRYGQLRLDDKRQIDFDAPSRLMWLEVAPRREIVVPATSRPSVRRVLTAS